MHELSIALTLIDVAERETRQLDGKVVALHVRIGALSGVVKEALLFSYEVAAADTTLAGTRLVIEDMPVTVYGPTCHAERLLVSAQLFVCPDCGALTQEVRQGKELQLTALEIAS